MGNQITPQQALAIEQKSAGTAYRCKLIDFTWFEGILVIYYCTISDMMPYLSSTMVGTRIAIFVDGKMKNSMIVDSKFIEKTGEK